jgi:SET domain-containing protein
MLLIETIARRSDIQGFGCFAAADIKGGTKVWEYTLEYDQTFTVSEFKTLPPTLKDHFTRYAYIDKTTMKYIYCSDNAKYFNHSETPNIKDSADGKFSVAIQDIKSGEELTCNYNDFFFGLSIDGNEYVPDKFMMKQHFGVEE